MRVKRRASARLSAARARSKRLDGFVVVTASDYPDSTGAVRFILRMFGLRPTVSTTTMLRQS